MQEGVELYRKGSLSEHSVAFQISVEAFFFFLTS